MKKKKESPSRGATATLMNQFYVFFSLTCFPSVAKLSAGILFYCCSNTFKCGWCVQVSLCFPTPQDRNNGPACGKGVVASVLNRLTVSCQGSAAGTGFSCCDARGPVVGGRVRGIGRSLPAFFVPAGPRPTQGLIKLTLVLHLLSLFLSFLCVFLSACDFVFLRSSWLGSLGVAE